MIANGWKLGIALLLPLLTGFAASQVTVTGAGSWYAQLNKPEWNPPGWVFAPVWTSLYLMMGIALYLVWKSDAPVQEKRTALMLWFGQMVLNGTWSFLFFGAEHTGAAFAEILVLWLVILGTIFAFARIHRLAAWLLVPYIAWVSFAAILNGTIWKMN
ncbi:MAG TPA: TspO/MBR family protein [Chitinophagaceae bacterium]|jgi:tryptophan-rich sensory protein|nr:TspO/MBR family protein [Chitinophagaceae bacterium]